MEWTCPVHEKERITNTQTAVLTILYIYMCLLWEQLRRSHTFCFWLCADKRELRVSLVCRQWKEWWWGCLWTQLSAFPSPPACELPSMTPSPGTPSSLPGGGPPALGPAEGTPSSWWRPRGREGWCPVSSRGRLPLPSLRSRTTATPSSSSSSAPPRSVFTPPLFFPLVLVSFVLWSFHWWLVWRLAYLGVD